MPLKSPWRNLPRIRTAASAANTKMIALNSTISVSTMARRHPDMRSKRLVFSTEFLILTDIRQMPDRFEPTFPIRHSPDSRAFWGDFPSC
jgi:hypothetical protein